jgi:hypothetical protein
VKTEVIRLRLTKQQKTKLKAFADKKQTTVSHVIVEYINRLPNPSESH